MPSSPRPGRNQNLARSAEPGGAASAAWNHGCWADLALGAIRAVRRAARSVPGDVSVVGFDDSAFMNCTDPRLDRPARPAV